MYKNNIYPNYIMSVRVPFGLEITMWNMNGQDGTKTRVGGKKKENEAFFCSGAVPEPGTARSLSVDTWYPEGQGPPGTKWSGNPIKAQWIQVGTGSGRIQYDLKTTVTNSSGSSNTATDRTTLMASTTVGFEFEGVSASVTLSAEASRETANTITKELSQSNETTF